MSLAIRVLYVEDNFQDADLTRSHFAEHAPECELVIVDTGRKCLEELSKGVFDVLLLDRRLPDLDGLDVLRALRHEGWQVPVVMVTGVGDEDLVVTSLRLGASNYVSKQGNYLETLPDLLCGVVEEHHQKPSHGLLSDAPRRILFIEHLSMDIELTVQHFAEAAPNFMMDVVHSCAEAMMRLERLQAYDLALIDLRMPDQSGLEFVREAKSLHLPLPPFIIISGKGDEAMAIACLKLGAADYVAKRDGYLNQLVHTIDRVIAYDQLNRLDGQLRAELAQRELAEVALHREFAFTKAILDTVAALIVAIDHEGRIVRFNAACERLTGWLADEVIGRSLWDLLVPEEQRSGVETAFDALMGGEFSSQHENDWVCRDGSRRWIAWTNTVLRDAAGTVQCVLGAGIDITDRKHTEELLQHAKEAAEAANRAKDDFLANMSHELRTPLNAIIGFTEGLLERVDRHPLNTHQIERLTNVLSSGQLLLELISGVLDFTKATAGKTQVNLETFDVGLLAGEVGKVAEALLNHATQVHFTLDVEEGLPPMHSDREVVRKILSNLVSNAVKFTRQGTIVLRIRRRDESLVMEVEDTGIGMRPEHRDRVFEKFYQAPGASVSSLRGTGLGLSICKSYTELLGGTITLRSELGQGSTVTVTLPLESSGQ